MTADRLESIVGGCGVVLSIELKRKAIADVHGILQSRTPPPPILLNID